MRIIIVCTGNTCRSPMCEAIFKKKFGSNAEIISRGLFVEEPAHASFNAEAIMSEIGLDITNHISKQLKIEEVLSADLILTMTKAHKDRIISVCPEMKDKVFTLCEFAGSDGDICDPYGGDLNTYRICANQIIRMSEAIKL